ncbi:hypothetical protein [Streptomyces sp. NPDC091278]|uniref:hypothetical protein n=1 Tax=Streptomyces sp. NPDC091278 TaxID=3155301 RepID=UPI00344BC749
MSDTSARPGGPEPGDGPLDPAQLVRITSLHRGFLYQHLYAVGCLLRLGAAGAERLLVERDEDIEVLLPGRRLYLQVKTRARPLRGGDVNGAVDAFSAVRARHADGGRPGRPRLVVVSNQPPGPGLAARTAADDWPPDVLLLTPGSEPPEPWLPPAWTTLDEAVAWCAGEAARVPFTSLSPHTLVWKLAARVVLACTGHGGQGFTADELPPLYEQFVQELQAFPAAPTPYLPRATEPELLTGARVRLVTGFSGAGKTAWASQAAAHSPEPLTYFDVAALPAEAVAGSLARELAARHLDRAARTALPNGTGTLRAVHHRLAGTPVAIVLDNAHRLDAHDLRHLVEALPTARFVLLGQPRPDQAAFAARLDVLPETLDGWTADSVASVFADADCPVDRPTAERLVGLTGGLPLYVRNAARLTRTHHDGDAARFCTALSARAHTAPTVQDLILAEVFDALDGTARTTAYLLATAEVPLTDEEVQRLAHAAGLGGPAPARAMRSLTSYSLVQRTGTTTTLHDAVRSLATEYAPDGVDRPVEEALRDLLAPTAGGGGTTLPRLARWMTTLPRTGRTEELLRFTTHDFFFEQSFAAGLAPTLRAVASDERAAPMDRFDSLNALAILAQEADERDVHGRLVDDLDALVAAHPEAWGTRERSVLATQRMARYAHTGDLASMNAAYLTARAENADGSLGSRVLRFNQARCFFLAGRHEQADLLALDLAEASYAALGLTPEDVLGAGPEELRVLLGEETTRLDDFKRLADCLALVVRCRRELGTSHGLAAMHALKFYHLAQAWRPMVGMGQEVADDFVGIGDLRASLDLLEQTLLPLVERYRLDDLVVGVRSQRAVVIAHTGDHATALAELDVLQRYDVPPGQAEELAHQRALVLRLAAGARGRPS